MSKGNSGQAGRLVLADGRAFEGTLLGAQTTTTGEAVFTTGMTGYQESITDPSYCQQALVMTAAQIGNTGVNPDDDEAEAPAISALVIQDLTPHTSNWRTTETLDAYLKRHGVPCLINVDTRALTAHIRDKGAQMCAVGPASDSSLGDKAKSAPPMEGAELASRVSTKAPYDWETPPHQLASIDSIYWLPKEGGGRRGWRVAVLDYGIKRNILRRLVESGCDVRVFPADTDAETIKSFDPEGIFLSNGPGDPAATTKPVETLKSLLGYRPIFGICFGHQLLARAADVRTHKLKFGHRGVNQPVRDESTRRIEITSQNHGFVVDYANLPDGAVMTHRHLNDDTCEGLAYPDLHAFSVQYHPEASAGPHDATYLFKRFSETMARFHGA